MLDLMFEYRGVLVAVFFIALIVSAIAATLYGRRVIRTEKTDAVFGNPSRALGGWYWVITGVCFILIVWFYFSWDTARAFFPKSANELCQIAKLDYATNPVRSVFPLDNHYLKSTTLLNREKNQLNGLSAQIEHLDFSPAQQRAVQTIIALMEQALQTLTSTQYFDPETNSALAAIQTRINQLTENLRDENYPGTPTPQQQEQARTQARWGDSGNEIPLYPASPRGYKFDAAAKEMSAIAKDFRRIRNKNRHFLAQVDTLKTQIDNLTPASTANTAAAVLTEAQDEFVTNLSRLLSRIDDGQIFPPNVMDGVESALVALNKEQHHQQGGLRFIDTWLMPGGKISAGASACSEQGSGRWLPKPSDTLRTLARISDPDVGYKGFPLLWYKQKPVAEIIDFIIPDFLISFIPGKYPRHNDDASLTGNFKSQFHNVATGNFDSFTIPVPAGHIWDSLLRVLAGLFFGILFGVPLGLFMGLSRFSKGFFDPLIELYRPVPPLAWAPLILTIFGIQDDGKIFLLFMVAFAIMVISARTGATGTQLSKIHAAHSLGATNRQILRRVILPNSLPEILTGIRIAIGVCWGTLVAAEMLAGTTGIGFVENVARKQSDYEIIWTTIIILGLLGLIFDLVMRWVIAKVIPWRGKG